MDHTSGVGNGPRDIDSLNQTDSAMVQENNRADKAGAGVSTLTVSRIEMRGEVTMQTHDIAPPGPDAAQGTKELSHVAATNFDSSVNALTLVKTLMTKLFGTMAELRGTEHGFAKSARQHYAKSVDKKVDNMHEQAQATMAFGISSALVHGAFSIGSTASAFKGGISPHLAMARTQALSGLGESLSGVLDATGRGVDMNLEARNAKMDKFAQLYQSYQSEFNEAVQSARQSMQGANAALAEAGSKDDNTMVTVMGKLG
ncbi:MAG: hypothetical protein AAF936_08760 [Pseudomonadota bacterium]